MSEKSAPDYAKIIERRANHVFNIMARRVADTDLRRIRAAFQLAYKAHAPQKRKTGEPYILHPIAVANIAAEELHLDADSVIAAFLHDVVEDTPHTIDEIRQQFGDDVAFLVDVVTKREKAEYTDSKQVDNYRHMLDSLQYDIRAILVKIADRLHNMRTLSSMPPAKQMKIAGETDYFYAPLANRLGLYEIKTELENLGLRFRCPREYAEIDRLIRQDEEAQHDRLAKFAGQIQATLDHAGITARVDIHYRSPYSIWRKMHKYGDDFNHLKYRHFTEIVFPVPTDMTEKDMALHIYSVLTDRFKEKPGGISNYIDAPKENGYQSFHVKLLAEFGRWQEVHLSSERMKRDSQLGCVAERNEDNIRLWIEKFRNILRDICRQGIIGTGFIESVVTSFYNDDIMTFTPKGRSVVLPQKASVLDFAYEVSTELGEKARYARINGFLASVKAPLRRGDVVEVFTGEDITPTPDRLAAVVTYKAKKAISGWLAARPEARYDMCPVCHPIPGEEVTGYRQPSGRIMLHRRDCPTVIRLASQFGDNLVSVDFTPDATLYPVTIVVTAVDRFHLFVDLVDCISNRLHLTISSFNTETTDSIVTCRIAFAVHSNDEVETIVRSIASIDGVDTVSIQS